MLVYFFGGGTAEGTQEMKAVLGGKGANLAEMTNLGVPVPPGFTIACAACIDYLRDGRRARRAARRSRRSAAAARGGRRASGSAIATNPLLVSVRSGAPVSMPGMMETILNLGLNDRTVVGLARAERQRALRVRLVSPLHPDVRRRRARRARSHKFEHLLTREATDAPASKTDAELDEDALRNLVEEYKALVRIATGSRFPDGPADAAVGRDRSRLAVVDAQEGRRLPAREQHLRNARHRA